MTKSFTIITVSMNSAETIGDTVHSVRMQRGVQVQHILKDAVSQDETVKIAKKINPEMKIIVSQDLGIYDAMNEGFEHSDGDYIGFLNSDDYYFAPDVLAGVADIFAMTACDIVCGEIAMVDNNGRIRRFWRNRPLLGNNLNGQQLPHPSMFVRRSVLLALGKPFDPTYRISGDVKQQLILIEQQKRKVELLQRTVTVMRLGGASTKSLRMTALGWQESARAYREVHKRSGTLYVMRKVFSKFEQLFLRPRSTNDSD